jgi:hypothetical protein
VYKDFDSGRGEFELISHAHSLSRDFERRCGLRSTSDTQCGPMSLSKDRKALSSWARSIVQDISCPPTKSQPAWFALRVARQADAGSVARSGVTGIAYARSAVDGSCLGRLWLSIGLSRHVNRDGALTSTDSQSKLPVAKMAIRQKINH